MDAQSLASIHQQLVQTLDKLFGEEGVQHQVRLSCEAQLKAFRQQPVAVEAAQHFLQQSQHQYVLWFSASLLNEVVLEKWSSIDDVTAKTIRTNALSALVANSEPPKVWPTMVAEKVLAVVCAVAMHDFPHRYPEYFSDVQKLVRNEPTLGVGVRLVRFTLEEFPLAAVHSRPLGRTARGLSSRRIDELTTFMQKQIGGFVPILQDVLEHAAKEARAGEDALKALEIICDAAPMSVAAGIAGSTKLLQLLFAYLSPKPGPDGSLGLSAYAPVAIQVLSSLLRKQCLSSAHEHGFAVNVAKQVRSLMHPLRRRLSARLSSYRIPFCFVMLGVWSIERVYIVSGCPRGH